jgi:hypothetical protein
MQVGTQAEEPEPMTPARRRQLVSALADGDLDTINTLFDEFSQAFPVFTMTTADWPISLGSCHSYDYTCDLTKALVAASSRGLHVIAGLLGSRSRSSEDWGLQWESPQLREYVSPLIFVHSCSTLCGRVMKTYVSTTRGNAAAGMDSRQAELAATARSTGGWQQNSCGKHSAALTAVMLPADEIFT